MYILNKKELFEMYHDNIKIQIVSWKVRIPELGEKILIGIKDLKFKANYYVIDIIKNKENKIDFIVVRSELGECHTLGILNGEWKIIDPHENRTVTFSKNL